MRYPSRIFKNVVKIKPVVLDNKSEVLNLEPSDTGQRMTRIAHLDTQSRSDEKQDKYKHHHNFYFLILCLVNRDRVNRNV
jgi:hypothetical protein